MFTLHERLAADTTVLGDFALSRLLLMNDNRYPWCILVPKVVGAVEIYRLDESQQGQLWRESSMLSEVMMSEFEGKKLNVAALGNMVPQLHVHHVVRFEGDEAWPGPVWGVGKASSYSEDFLIKRTIQLQTRLIASCETHSLLFMPWKK